MNQAANQPLEDSQKRLFEREKTVSVLQRRHRSIGNARLAVFLLFALLCWLYVRSSPFSPWWLVATIMGFIVLALVHQRTLRATNKAERAAEMYRRSVARMEDRWSGSGETGWEFRQPGHLYSDDLNILGDGSLFKLLCVARSPVGRECLAQWLRPIPRCQPSVTVKPLSPK